MKSRRVSRLNSLLKEVLSDVIRKDLRNPHLTNLLTVTEVEITPDMQHAKVFISVIGNEAKKKETMDILIHARGYIAVLASKEVDLRYFPQLQFVLDDGVEKQMRIDALLQDISNQQKKKETQSEDLSDNVETLEDEEEALEDEEEYDDEKASLEEQDDEVEHDIDQDDK